MGRHSLPDPEPTAAVGTTTRGTAARGTAGVGTASLGTASMGAASKDPEHTQPIPTLAPPVGSARPGATPGRTGAGLPRRVPGAHGAGGTSQVRAIAPRTLAGLTRVMSATGVAEPGPAGGRTGTTGGVNIPSQRRPVISSGRLPAVPAPPAPADPPAARLLAGWLASGEPDDLAAHLRRHGELPRERFAGRRGAARLLEIVDASGLRGRGGAGFPTARKMSAVLRAASARRRPVVVANGCEGDPTSAKDQLLLRCAPHLVLDGMALAAHAVGADQAILCVPEGSPLVEPLREAIGARAEEPAQVHVVTAPHRFVASEASALVNFLTTGEARPTSSSPRPAERGVQGRPTLVDNVETLAHLALLARHGVTWFRARGTESSPGTMLCTVGGHVARPGVHEVDLGTPVHRLLDLAGGPLGPSRAVLLGGLGGSWAALPDAAGLPLTYRGPDHAGPALGLASLFVPSAYACGLSVTSVILRYLALESAGQCGPCMFGLPAIAEDVESLVKGEVDPELLDRLRRRLGVIPGRGACSHPDGAVRMAASALEVFADDAAAHAAGRPCAAALAGPASMPGAVRAEKVAGRS